MRITVFSDYALRVLMYAAANSERLITVGETARAYNVSRSHLTKVVTFLTAGGFLRSVRGRAGGFTLAMAPKEMSLGAILRRTEANITHTSGRGAGKGGASATPASLRVILDEAMAAFGATLDRYTLADIVLPRAALPRLIGQNSTDRVDDHPAETERQSQRRYPGSG
ncbi:BadM/Rrf2 family transcriptional regulator [Dongia mobilis]|uniref:BadM/Rrf2 family transcriptional regulator n=1 Tax=Dongia mobilis TaxID=578943 RepID=A0A4R6WV09_9PROT|nr:Rrf2 family transcriptional regulator [Dongia mobilis]TDQ82912.1 BadM/Rrf2 family transcriptional regulator [Dongia mobilis]